MAEKGKDGSSRSEGHAVSRRSFLKFGGAAGLAAMAAGSLSLAGCAPQGASSEGSVATLPDGSGQYRVFSTDMLIVGAGFATMSALSEAVKRGKSVLVLDKGPYGFGGAIGMNWDVAYTWAPRGTEQQDVNYASRTTNKKLFKAASESDPNVDGMVTAANWGETVTARNEDGTPKLLLDLPQNKMYERGFPRHWQDKFGASDFVTVHDRVMVTDLFISDGRCIGAMGIHLPTGEFRVYRADATMVATGGSCWMFGWHTICPTSINSPDNTSDAEMAAFRHGARIGDSEHAAYDLMGVSPSGYACSDGAIFGGDSMHVKEILDKDGNPFAASDEYDQERMVTDRPYFNRVVAETILDGKGSPNGGLYVEVTEESRAAMRQMYARNVTMLEDKLGLDFSKDLMECMIEMYEHGGTPVIDEKMMSTEFPGLFCARGAGVGGEAGGSQNSLNRKYGSYCFRCALDYLEGSDPVENIDWTSVEEEYKRLEDLRTRKPDDALRPFEVRRKIQEVGGKTLGIIRKTEDLEAGRDELARIRKEDIPRMALASETPTYNTEWKEAIENFNLLDLTELSIEATLARPESRGNIFRPEYPEIDDENWKCMLAFKRNDKGELDFDKVFYEPVEW